MPKKSSSIRTFQRSMRYRRDLLVDVPRNHKSSNATRLKLCKIRRHKKLVSILPRADMENIEREREKREGKWEKNWKGRRVWFWRRENVFELVSRAVSRKRRGVSRRWPNITQRSLFRATREAGARNRNDLEHTGPSCLTVALPRGRHFHRTTTPLCFSIEHDATSRRHEPRDFTRLVDRHPARFCHLLSTFSRRGQESQARASRFDALGNPGP